MSKKTEAEQLAEIEKEKEKIVMKFALIARKRLAKINPLISPNRNIVDMTEKEFNEFIDGLKKKTEAQKPGLVDSLKKAVETPKTAQKK